MLDVSQSYLEVMTPYARIALLKHSNNHDTVDNTCIGIDVNGQLRKTINELLVSGDLLGCQVSVVQNGKVVIDLCGGLQTPYENVKVSSDTLFPCFSVTKGIASTCIHLLAQDGLLDLNSTVSSYWPEFAENGKENITIANVLNHQAGLSQAGVDELLRDPFIVTNEEYMIQLMASAIPDEPPGTSTKYHALSFGWIVAGIVRKVTGKSIFDFSKEKIAKTLDIEKEFFIGLGLGGYEENKSKLASLVLSNQISKSVMTTEDNNNNKNTKSGSNVNDLSDTEHKSNIKEKSVKTEKSEKSETTNISPENKRRPPSSPSLLMNPTFFNNKKIRESIIPAANGHFSANALSRFYYSLINNKEGKISYIIYS